MNESEAAFVLAELGFARVQMGSGVVKAQCPCSSRNDVTFRVITGTKHPGYYCHRCKTGGSLLALVWENIRRDLRPYTRALYVTNESIINATESVLAPGRMDYKPMAGRAVERWDAPPRAHKPVTGVQLDLEGRVMKALPPKPYREASFQKFGVGDQAYMLDRGFDWETLEAFQVRWNNWGNRVVFPIRNWDGTIKGVSQRLVWDHDWCMQCKASLLRPEGGMVYKCECGRLYAKYLHSKGLKRNEILYGEWLYGAGAIPVLVEGMTDVMNLWMRGMRPENGFMPLAVMGSHPGEWQIARLLNHIPNLPVAVVRDRDDPADYPELPDGVAPGDLMIQKVLHYVHAREPGRQVIEVVPDKLKVDPGMLLNNHVQAAMGLISEAVKNSVSSGSFPLAI